LCGGHLPGGRAQRQFDAQHQTIRLAVFRPDAAAKRFDVAPRDPQSDAEMRGLVVVADFRRALRSS
jgi:hypothetical protein